MVAVPFPPFEPDANRYNTNALPIALNVVPLKDGWRPLQSIVNPLPSYERLTDIDGNRLTDIDGNYLIVGPGGSSLGGGYRITDPITGLFAARKKDGTEALFAGTDTTLYKFNRSSFVWEDVSGASAPYASACRWSFVKFGSVVYCQNGNDPEQMFDIETDLTFSDNATAPICKYLAVVGSFVFRGNIVSWSSQSITNAPDMIQCSALENPQDNEPQNFNFSDYQSIPTGDEVMGIVPVSGGAHIWMRNALQGITLTLTSDYTFTRTPINEMRGTSAPYSIGIVGQDDYSIYCDDGFWRFQGGTFNPIGNGRVNSWFLTESDQNDRENVLAMPDPEHNVVWTAYTDADATRKMLGYHYNFDRWCQSDVYVQASTRSRTFAYSQSTPPIVETDLLRFAIIDASGTLGYLVGNNLPATITTNEIQFSNNRAFANSAQLIGDPQIFTITPATTDVRGGTFRVRNASSPSARSGRVPMRADGRTHRFQVDIQPNITWTNAISLDVEISQTGQS